MIQIEAETPKNESTLAFDVIEVKEALEKRISEESSFAPHLESPVTFRHTFNEGKTLDQQFSTTISVIYETPEEAEEAKKIFDLISADNRYKGFRLIKGTEQIECVSAYIGM